MRDAKIVTLYKNEGERSDCNNYRGIFLLSIIGKVLRRVTLNWLQRLADRVYPESQCGFRTEMSIWSSPHANFRRTSEDRRCLYFAFIDLTKAFDLVSRDGLFKILILLKIGCPPKLQSMIESFYTDVKGTVQFNNPLRIYSSVKQGSVLAPTLFWIFFAVLLMHFFSTANERTYVPTRSDGRLFNLARLRAKTKDREALIRDMHFADDAAVASLMGHFSCARASS